MKDLKVTFQSIGEVQEFVHVVNQYPCNLDMRRGRITIDAKSILGIMALGIGQEVFLQMPDENCEGLVHAIGKYCVEL